MKKRFKRLGALFYVPLLFMLLGYLVIYIIGTPVINFATSAVDLILLNDAPSFDQKSTNLYEQSKNKIAHNDKEKTSDSEKNQEDTKEDSSNESLASSKVVYPSSGDQFGEVVIDKVNINVPLYYGDSDDILRLGAGQYIGSMIPGDIGTTLIGAHNQPVFGKIYYLEPEDEINILTHYGEYTYKVTESKIANYKDPLINEKLGDRSKHSLILYTCYPLDAIGLTPERVFVFADLVSGPIIDEKS
ncbi:class D sortase [Enterococcus sp. LJL99]